jgi:hypothetical protein
MRIPKSFTLAGILWTVEETAAISDMGIAIRKRQSSGSARACPTK